MAKLYTYIIFLLTFVFIACDRNYDSPLDNGNVNAGVNEESPNFYMDLYDPISDEGQYWHPDMIKNLPDKHYELYATSLPNKNDVDVSGGDITAVGGAGLQYHLLCHSLTGINNLAMADGKITTGIWMDAANNLSSYKEARAYVNMASPDWVVWAGNMLTNPGFSSLDGGVIEALGKNYVLTDVKNNPESSVVAVVASHVYKSIIVDVRDEKFFIDNGYKKVYDATRKTTLDSWKEFKQYCNNNALVIMPAQTGELADFVISNKLFAINLNKEFNTSTGGQNVELLKEVLAWLSPNSLVYGWEPGVGEDEFVNLVSKSGNMVVAIAEYNLPYFAYDYKSRQKSILAKVINPHDIDYSKTDKKFVSYYLSDGPHAGWMMNGFVENYYTDPNVDKVKMSFGITASNISQIAPLQFEKIMNLQKRNTTLIESFGGGYYYSDDFGINGDRKILLNSLAQKVAAHMRQHRIKVLEQIAHDPKSEEAKEAYQAFVDANNQLEGIIAIQYAPSYAEGNGDILWVTNKDGFDIPVITVRYSIWNMGSHNTERDGTPAYIANKLNSESEDAKFSAVIVHAWSTFKDIGESLDEIAENEEGGEIRGASAAEMCARRLNNDYEVVNIQELIWRVRMHYRPEQTKKYLELYY
ncbi:MAG TPA: GxGYxYP family putative glycoside hydrolase [Bacteroidaceae bacterium]|nr:GxGYxYP family putative glycoside hydrolase [Bacteroidaceae bacterium]